jgi:hypothetical protein
MLTSTPTIQSICKKAIVKKILKDCHSETRWGIPKKLPGDSSSFQSSEWKINEGRVT